MAEAMSPATTAPERRLVLGKSLLVLVGGALIVFMLRFYFNDALPYLVNYTEETYGIFWPRSGRLYLHIVGGSVALLLGPLQFWTGLRRRNMALHRWIGKGYLAGIALGATGGFWLAATTDTFPGYSWSISLAALSFVWVLTTGMAYISIRAGKISLHKEWMVRSYVVTFAFVTFRFLVDEAPFMQPLAPPDRYPTAIWLSWTLPLIVAEAVMQGRKLRKG